MPHSGAAGTPPGRTVPLPQRALPGGSGIGWAVSAKPDTDLAVKALDMAYEHRNKPQLALFHSDQGSPVRQAPIPATTLALPDAAEYESPMERLFRSLKSEQIL